MKGYRRNNKGNTFYIAQMIANLTTNSCSYSRQLFYLMREWVQITWEGRVHFPPFRLQFIRLIPISSNDNTFKSTPSFIPWHRRRVNVRFASSTGEGDQWRPLACYFDPVRSCDVGNSLFLKEMTRRMSAGMELVIYLQNSLHALGVIGNPDKNVTSILT